MRKQTRIAVAFGLLFTGNALAFDTGHFSGLSRWQTPGDGAAQSGTVTTTMASATSEVDFPAAAGALNVSASVPTDAGRLAGPDGLPVDGALDQDGHFSTKGSRLAQNASTTSAPPKAWLLILAGLGIVGVMVERTKRRVV